MLEIFKRLAFVTSFIALLGIYETTFAQDDPSVVAVETEIRDFFRDFEAATREETAERQMTFFDFAAFIDGVIGESGVEIASALRNQLLAQVSVATRREYEALDDRWTRHKIVSVLWTEDKEIAEVFVRHWSEDLTTWRTVYYLKRTDNGLKIYDWMDLALGFSTVSLTAAILRDGASSNFPPQVSRGMRCLFRAMMALMQGDEDGATEWIEKCTGTAVSPVLEALRWNLGAAVNAEYEPVYALECVDKVEAFNDRVIMASLMRASAHMQLGNYERVVRYAQDFLDQYGADADTFFTLGVALKQLDRTEEAIAALKAGLKDTPDAIDLVEELAITLPDDRKQEFVASFKALPDPIEQFEYLADSFESYEDPVALETLIEVASTMSDDLPHMGYYRILPLIFKKQHDEAFRKLATAIKDPKTDPDYLTYYESWLCNLAGPLGKEIEAYDVCIGKSEALDALVYQLEYPDDEVADAGESDAETLAKERAAKIELLYERHLKATPDDPEAWSMRANRQMQAEDFEAALISLKKALELTDDPDDQYSILEDCVVCYVNLEQEIQGYRALEDKQTAFDCFSYVMDEESPAFQAIKKLHREQFPNDLVIIYSDISSLYEAKKYGEVKELADSAIADNPNKDDSWELSRIRFYRILSLAHLNRSDDALIAARGEEEETRDHLRALIYAIKGQRERFAEAYKRCCENSVYFDRQMILNDVTVPEEWFPVMTAAESSEYSPESELRRVVFLLPEPIELSGFLVQRATKAVGLRLSEIQRDDISSSNNDFICALNDRAVLVAVDQCRYFLSTGNEPYAANLMSGRWGIDVDFIGADVIAEYEAMMELEVAKQQDVGQADSDRVAEVDDSSEIPVATEKNRDANSAAELSEDSANIADLREAIKAHRAWFAIDIYTWPQNLDSESTSVIPVAAGRRLAKLAKQIVGGRGTVAVHPDSDRVVVCSDGFFESLLSEDPMSAFADETDPEQ